MIKLSYYHNQLGETCEHCGRGIKHIYLVENENGIYKVGSTCIIKLTKMSETGSKLFTKSTKNLSGLYKEYEELQSKLTEELRNEYVNEYFGERLFKYCIDKNTMIKIEATKQDLYNIGSWESNYELNEIYKLTEEINNKFGKLNIKL